MGYAMVECINKHAESTGKEWVCDSLLLHVPALSLQPCSQGLFFFLNAFMPVHESRTVKDCVYFQEVNTSAENQLSVFSLVFLFLSG